jgi:hypothetical protein
MEQKNMAETKSEIEPWLNYIIKPFARHFFVSSLYVQLLAAKDWHSLFFLYLL